jgi:hypothetical protein
MPTPSSSQKKPASARRHSAKTSPAPKKSPSTGPKRAELRPGQKVSWKSSGATIRGTVKRKLTSPMKIKGHLAKASPEHPEYLVQSAKTGALAAHKPDALHPE